MHKHKQVYKLHWP